MSISGGVAATLNATQRGIVARHEAASSSVAVVEGGRIVYEGATGLRNLDGAAATPRTLYRIGSITKVFTAVAVMQLVESGRLSLDDRLARFYPAFPNASAITVRDLLMHRSGISNYLDRAIGDGRTFAPTTPEAIIAAAAQLAPLSAPGTQFAYSNTNYVLLGRIVERLSRLSLDAYERAHIFAPAGMRETFADVAPPGMPVATGYQLSNGNAPERFDLSWAYGCGNLISTAGDLARFDIALMNGTLLAPRTFAQMQAAALPSGDGERYGLGLMLSPFGTQTLVGHHGGLPGFEADDELIPARHFAVVALGNDGDYPTRSAVYMALLDEDPQDAQREWAAQMRAATKQLAAARPLTARFTAFFAALLKGRIQSAELSSAMQRALTPGMVAQIDALYAPLGGFERLEYAGEDTVASYHRYRYTAYFAHGSKALIFVLDADGKIAGFFNG